MLAALAAILFFIPSAIGSSFELRLISQTNNRITLGWDAQPNVAAYVFYANGQRVSHTFDGSRTQVTFAKVSGCTERCYGVDDLVSDGQATYPSPTPPPPAPTVTITGGPANPTTQTTATFSWTSTNATSFSCKLDTAAATACSSPQTYSGLSVNSHTFVVTASGAGGSAQASANWTIQTTPPPPSCNLNATPSNFAVQVSAATAGQTVCLATGNYGTWGGTNKAITVQAASGAAPQMRFSFGSGDTSFTLRGMTAMGGALSDGARNITIADSDFNAVVNVSGANTDGIVFDGNKHNWMVGPSTGVNAKIYLENSLTGTLAAPSVTIRRSEIKNGDLDGIHFGGGSGYQILDNVFDNLCDQNANHTDNMQFDTSPTTNVRIAGNYVHAVYSCGTQGITSYDHGTAGNVIIENNVVDIHRPWGIELYADVNSIVRNNTVVYYPGSNCYFNTPCGKINVTNKSGDPVSTGTQVYDNLAIQDIGACSGCTADHNVSANGAVYVGPLTTHDGFLLSPSSPVGRGAARDGSNVGVYAAP